MPDNPMKQGSRHVGAAIDRRFVTEESSCELVLGEPHRHQALIPLWSVLGVQ
jgi:hypothetical protein